MKEPIDTVPKLGILAKAGSTHSVHAQESLKFRAP